jgi:hypothetical protein
MLTGVGLVTAFASYAIWPSRFVDLAGVSLERQSPELISVVRGAPVVSEFRIRNGTRRSLSIEGIETGCGCAVLTTGKREALGASISAHGSLFASLRVDTSNRAMGDFTIPLNLFVSDSEGMRYRLHALQHIRVNPGWATNKQRLTLKAANKSPQAVVDELVLYQTSPDHPFRIINVTLKQERVKVDIREANPDAVVHDTVVAQGGDMQWKAVPRYRVRVTAPSASITQRETAQLCLDLSHNLTRVALDVELIPAAQPLRIVPAELRVDPDAACRTSSFVVTTDSSWEALTFHPSDGVTILGSTPLAKKLVKVDVRIDHALCDDGEIVVCDGVGNERVVALTVTR